MTPIRPTNHSHRREPTRKPTLGKPVVDWLSNDHQFSLLIQTQARLVAIQADLNQHLSLRGLQVASIESQTLTLIASGAAQASKLRQVEPIILARLRQIGVDCSRINVRPQSVFPAVKAPATDPRLPISDQAAVYLATNITKLSDGPVKQALTDLLENRRKFTLKKIKTGERK